MSSTTSATNPLPSLPIEMKRAILSFCETPTLGNASLVSISFLELASPFLYKDIVVQGLQQFERLFYEEKPTSLAPHLDHLFSLSQLRNFTFLGVRNDAFTRYAFQITTARLPSTAPLKINRLEVRFGRDDVFNEDGEPNEGEPNPPNLFSSMMDLFDPLHTVFSSPLGYEEDELCPFSLILEVENWTRLRTWCWSNVALESFFNIGSPSISTLHFLENLPGDSLSFFFDDRVIKRTGWDFIETRVVELLGVDGADPGTALLLCPVVKEVVFHLSSQEDAHLALDAFEYMLEDCDMEGERRKRMTEVVRLEVDE